MLKKKQYISWSEMNLFFEDRDEYKMRYIVGIPFQPTPPMRYGSIIHNRLAGVINDEQMKERILEIGYMPDKIRIAQSIIKGMEGKIQGEAECKIFTELEGIKIFSIIDVFDRQAPQEHKTKSGNWSQQDADEHRQIDFYCMAIQLKYGVLPEKFILNSLNTLNGKVNVLETKRSVEDIEQMKNKVRQFRDELTALGWWDKRISTWSE